MNIELITCYAIMGNKFPNRSAYYHFLQENKGIFLGTKHRFAPNIEPHFFKTPGEAETWIKIFLEKQPEAEKFQLKVVECKIKKEFYDRHFKAKNYFLKIEMLPSKFFETRPNLKPAYLRGELVLGHDNAITKSGQQRWFETEKAAREHADILVQQAFQGFLFKIEKALKNS